MKRNIAIGIQNYSDIIENNCFYVDKSSFIQNWWDSRDSVTLITRPRRFGKTLTMSMVESFFSIKYAERSDLFEEFSIWTNEKYRKLQGTYPVLCISFSDVKDSSFDQARKTICRIIKSLYKENDFLLESDVLSESEKADFLSLSIDMEDHTAAFSLKALSDYLFRYYGKKVIILLDEYDTPLQEAYMDGYWDEMSDFIRLLFNSTFKTNPWLERAILTGITRISKESIFSDLNNLKVVTTTSDEYADCFGFTEAEVFAAMDEFGYTNKAEIKNWYDGFVFGNKKDIYNPWSILNFLDTGKLGTYWVNTSSNKLVEKLIQKGDSEIKTIMEDLLQGNVFRTQLDEQIIFSQLDYRTDAIWSLLLTSGYLKVVKYELDSTNGREEYELALTNMEVRLMFEEMIKGWFSRYTSAYNKFIKALLQNDTEEMNEYMNTVALQTFRFFDTGSQPSECTEPERFYHGFVLGLMVDLRDRYRIRSNRESGFGRYDVVLEPISTSDHAMIIEFKTYNSKKEQNLDETLQNALQQIEDKKYETDLLTKGITADKIRKYGFAFKGKTVLIG